MKPTKKTGKKAMPKVGTTYSGVFRKLTKAEARIAKSDQRRNEAVSESAWNLLQGGNLTQQGVDFVPVGESRIKTVEVTMTGFGISEMLSSIASGDTFRIVTDGKSFDFVKV